MITKDRCRLTFTEQMSSHTTNVVSHSDRCRLTRRLTHSLIIISKEIIILYVFEFSLLRHFMGAPEKARKKMTLASKMTRKDEKDPSRYS